MLGARSYRNRSLRSRPVSTSRHRARRAGYASEPTRAAQPMIVTAIKPQRSHPDRVNVHVDGEFRLALALEIASGALRVGDVVTEARLRELQAQDRRWKAREAALHLLSYRARTGTELRRRLRDKEFSDEVAEATVAELEERDLVDDGAFSEAFVRDRVRFRPRGRRRLVQELRSRGVDPDTARSAIEEVWEAEEISELDLARDAAAKWSPRMGEEPLRARRRLWAYLARRGFGPEVARTVVEELLPRGER